LQKLLAGLRKFPEGDALGRSIQFLSASYEATLEIAYFMAFSAMENAVNACVGREDQELVSKAQWKKLEPLIREGIDAASVSLGLGAGISEEIKKKAPELRRSSLQSRVEAACSRFAPKTDDLWPIEGFLEGIKRAARVRNDLFHAADAADWQQMHGDLIRIRTFTERLLLRALNWPVEDIWVWYDQDLKWLNGR
jgi:hypothetical protein